jgi:hypothetical protein
MAYGVVAHHFLDGWLEAHGPCQPRREQCSDEFWRMTNFHNPRIFSMSINWPGVNSRMWQPSCKFNNIDCGNGDLVPCLRWWHASDPVPKIFKLEPRAHLWLPSRPQRSSLLKKARIGAYEHMSSHLHRGWRKLSFAAVAHAGFEYQDMYQQLIGASKGPPQLQLGANGAEGRTLSTADCKKIILMQLFIIYMHIIWCVLTDTKRRFLVLRRQRVSTQILGHSGLGRG